MEGGECAPTSKIPEDCVKSLNYVTAESCKGTETNYLSSYKDFYFLPGEIKQPTEAELEIWQDQQQQVKSPINLLSNSTPVPMKMQSLQKGEIQSCPVSSKSELSDEDCDPCSRLTKNAYQESENRSLNILPPGREGEIISTVVDYVTQDVISNQVIDFADPDSFEAQPQTQKRGRTQKSVAAKFIPSSGDFDRITDEIQKNADFSLNPNDALIQSELNAEHQPIQPHKHEQSRKSEGSPPFNEAQHMESEEATAQSSLCPGGRGRKRKLAVVKLETQTDMEITTTVVTSSYSKLRKALGSNRKRSKKSIFTGAQQNRLTLCEVFRVCESDRVRFHPP
ncbi:unnamed protein product [Rodentolepis nana]|uniref:Breast cancer type 1 susceptibility protein homolog n=1 Tax=Rodentolepis nana TaxID=102285 RepID=A0A0R3T5T5_RODNA|nr:unnamed protein product [Rodentolepis nana]